jgi:hypothetical protein
MTIIRNGQPRPADEAFQAWTSNDMPRMLKALNSPTHPIDRHFLLQAIVNQAYKEREDPAMLKLAEEVAWKYVSEFESLVPALREEFGDKQPGGLPQIPIFKHLATVLVERGLFSKAVEVCEYAMQFGLSDGTKGGFDSRIQKIRKQEQKRR